MCAVSIVLPACLSVSPCLSTCRCVCLGAVCLNVCDTVCMCVCLSVWLCACLSLCISAYRVQHLFFKRGYALCGNGNCCDLDLVWNVGSILCFRFHAYIICFRFKPTMTTISTTSTTNWVPSKEKLCCRMQNVTYIFQICSPTVGLPMAGTTYTVAVSIRLNLMAT